MVRQEDLSLVYNETGSVVIRDRQFLGRENRYTLISPSEQHLIARTPADVVFPVGETVDVAIATSHVQVFSPEQVSQRVNR